MSRTGTQTSRRLGLLSPTRDADAVHVFVAGGPHPEAAQREPPLRPEGHSSDLGLIERGGRGGAPSHVAVSFR
jgi:hypothetical protein